MKTHLIFLLILISYKAFSQNPIADFEVNIDYQCGYATIELIDEKK